MIETPAKSILERVIHIDTPENARVFLKWQFTDDQHRRMDELAVKSTSVGLTAEEDAEFREFCLVADLLAIVHLQATDALTPAAPRGG